MKKRAVIALGGNALITKGQQGTIYEQFDNARKSCQSIVQLIKAGWDVVITHGNGPQVGAIFLQNEAAKEITPAMPLGICVAESEGFIGYMLQQSLSNALTREKIEKPVVALITQVIVDRKDPSFKNPTKPIGPYYQNDDAVRMLKEGYKMARLPRGWRMLAPSPDPQRIVEGDVIRKLLNDGVIVIASGGGGMPVIEKKNWGLDGLEAVVDKDLAAERLAEAVQASVLLILTDVKHVYRAYNTPQQQPISRMTLKEIKKLYHEGQFSAGSMGPKILASIRFLEGGGKKVVISNIENGWDALQGKTGTTILPS